MTDVPLLSVAIVAFRTDHDLFERCLDSIETAAAAAGVEVEVIVADNSCNDDLSPFYGRVDRWIDMGVNAGFARAANRAIREAAGTNVLLLNPDAALEEPAIAQLLDALAARPNALFCGWLTAYGQTQVDAYLLWWTSTGRILRRRKYRRYLDSYPEGSSVPVQKVSGGALFGDRELLLSFGPFDERYFLYSEDVDLSFRATRAGVGLYAAKFVRVSHRASSSQASHSELVELARTDAALRLNAYRLWFPFALASRAEFALITVAGLLPGAGKTSGGRRVRLARFKQIKAWGMRRDMPRFDPATVR